MQNLATELYACPSCDCLFVALAGASASCPICKTASTHSGRDWVARRVASREVAEPAMAEERSFGEIANRALSEP